MQANSAMTIYYSAYCLWEYSSRKQLLSVDIVIF